MSAAESNRSQMGIMAMTKLMIGGILLGSLFLAGWQQAARADLIGMHSGTTDPLTEGFTTFSFGSGSSEGPIPNDLGKPAWSIAGSAQDSQFAYRTGALTAAQQAEIAATGFVLTAVARAVQGLSPAYDSINHVVIAEANIDTGVRRFDLGLGLTSGGDTVAVLATSVDNGGPGFSVREPGPTYTLSGSGWHTYQLVYNPTTQLVDLFVDGTDRIQGYAGDTSFVGNTGLNWAVSSGGQGDFNLVEAETGTLSVVPEPSTMILGGAGALLWIGYAARRRAARRGLARLLAPPSPAPTLTAGRAPTRLTP
jgi:PEP-CTERM motif